MHFHQLGDENKLLEEITGNLAAERLRDLHPDSHLPRIKDVYQGRSSSTPLQNNGKE